MSDSINKVGVVGLGIMGLAMSKNLRKAGFDVVGYSRGAEKRELGKKAGLSIAASAKETAEKSQVILLIVTDPQAVKESMSGENGILKAGAKGKTIVQMSTIDLETTLWAEKAAAQNGFQFLDCPVAGSKKQVDAAELILLAGGDENLIASLEPVLSKVGKHVVKAGKVGKGTGLKLCMNLIVAQMTTALCESVHLAELQGVDPAFIFEVIGESPALNCGYFQIKKEALLKKDFSVAFSLGNMLKDVRFMNQAAQQGGGQIPVNQSVQALMEKTKELGMNEKDLSVMYETLKNLKN